MITGNKGHFARGRLITTVAGHDYQAIDIGIRMPPVMTQTPKSCFRHGAGFYLCIYYSAVSAGRPYPKTAQVAGGNVVTAAVPLVRLAFLSFAGIALQKAM